MFSPHEAARVLVLGHNPDPDLMDLLRLWMPQWSFEKQNGSMSAWLEQLWREPPKGGLVLFLESMEFAELQVMSAWLNSQPGIPVLAVVGGRGLLGAEDLLPHRGVRLLPLPWTVAGLRHVLGLPSRQQAAADDSPLTATPSSSDDSSDSTGGDGKEVADGGGAKPTQDSDGIPRSNYSHSSGAGFSPCRPASELGKRSDGDKPTRPQANPANKTSTEVRPTSYHSGAIKPTSSPAAKPSNSPRPKPSSTSATQPNPTRKTAQTTAFGGEFLDGLVERFRDPLASLSGYLQMLRGQNQADSPFLEPAMRAAKEIETALEVLYLASDSHPAKDGRISGEHLAIEALKEAQRAGLSVQLALSEDFLLRTDQDLVRAGLQCARALLSLFGGADDNELVLHCKRNENWAVLQWQLAEPVTPQRTGSNPPPPFLSLLLQRFAEKLGAHPVLITTSHQVPQIVGLAWPAANTLAPVK